MFIEKKRHTGTTQRPLGRTERSGGWRRRGTALAAIVACFLLSGCLVEHVRQWGDVDEAVAVLAPANGSEAQGTVRFLQLQDGVKVIARLEGLEPGSTHAMHIHEYGHVTADDLSSAGAHYDPDDHPHDLPPAEERHAGDLGNVTADEDGRVDRVMTVHNLSVAEMDNPVIGRAVVLHAGRDTGEGTAGEAGPRIASGVIGVSNPGTLEPREATEES